MGEYASKGVAGAGLGLGIAGTALALLGGGAGNVLGMNNARTYEAHGDGSCMPVNRYEMTLQQENSRLQSEIALRDANVYSDQKLVETYKDLSGKISAVDEKLQAFEKEQCKVNAEQGVYNGVNTATIQCLQNQVAQLMGLTKVVIPNTSVCPGWGNVTITPATAATTATA